MKLKKILVMTIIILFAASGCKKTTEIQPLQEEKKAEETAYDKIQKILSEMQTYTTSATVSYISNKGTNVYDTIQHVRMSGEYRIEVVAPENAKGNVTFSDGTTITQYNKNIEGRVSVNITENMERSELFLSNFLRNYNNSQQVSVSVANLNEGECTILEATIPKNHPYISTQKLWISNETLEPVRMTIYDGNGSERIIIDYSNFEYNTQLPDNLFKME